MGELFCQAGLPGRRRAAPTRSRTAPLVSDGAGGAWGAPSSGGGGAQDKCGGGHGGEHQAVSDDSPAGSRKLVGKAGGTYFTSGTWSRFIGAFWEEPQNLGN